MKDSFVLVLLVGLIIFTGLYFLGNAREEGFVVKVIDGDTIVLNNSEKVRLLGINAPEKGELYYGEAKERLKELVLNKKVFLERDEEDRDRYGRLLRYVYLGDEMVNLKMLREGYATLYLVGERLRYERDLEEAEMEARKMRRGLWSQTSEHPCAGCIVLEEIHWNAEGDDCKNPNGEWVTLKNTCDFDCNLTGWSIKDSGTTVFKFPEFILFSGKDVKIFSGSGIETNNELYWNKKGSCKAVWNNEGDIIYLRDSEGKLVLRRAYEGLKNFS